MNHKDCSVEEIKKIIDGLSPYEVLQINKVPVPRETDIPDLNLLEIKKLRLLPWKDESELPNRLKPRFKCLTWSDEEKENE